MAKEYELSILVQLQKANWEVILKKLLAFAGECYPRVDAMDREDIVHKAIEKVFTGDQAWDPDKKPLINHLKLVLRSVASSKFELAYNKYRSEMPSLSDQESDSSLDKLSSLTKPLDEDICDRDIIETIFEIIKNDNEAELVLLSLNDGSQNPKEVSEDLEMDIETVRNAFRRIRYKIRKFLEKQEG